MKRLQQFWENDVGVDLTDGVAQDWTWPAAGEHFGKWTQVTFQIGAENSFQVLEFTRRADSHCSSAMTAHMKKEVQATPNPLPPFILV